MIPRFYFGRPTSIRTKDFGFGDRRFAAATISLHNIDRTPPTLVSLSLIVLCVLQCYPRQDVFRATNSIHLSLGQPLASSVNIFLLKKSPLFLGRLYNINLVYKAIIYLPKHRHYQSRAKMLTGLISSVDVDFLLPYSLLYRKLFLCQ